MTIRDRSTEYIRLKEHTMAQYGSICQCCGEHNVHVLNIDHVNTDGRKHREEVIKSTKNHGGGGGYAFYRWLKRNNYPEGYSVLCSNCNMCKGHHGFCPHNCSSSNYCFICSEDLDNNNHMSFYKENKLNICMNCVFNFSSKKEKIDKQWLATKSYDLNSKQLVITNYGGKCVECNENNPLFLTIDHIFGGGDQERKNGLVGVRFYRHLIKEGYPRNLYQLLCYNCNCNKSMLIKQGLMKQLKGSIV